MDKAKTSIAGGGDRYLDRVRTSLDEIRETHPHDARKQTELAPKVDDYRPSLERRKSIQEQRLEEVKVVDGAGTGTGAAAADGKAMEMKQKGKAVEEPMQPGGTRKSSLEEHMEKHDDDNNPLKTFPKSEGLTTAHAEELLRQYGLNELPEKKVPKWYVFCSLLWQPMPVMIWVAAAVEVAISNYDDMAILIAINLINASLSFYETTKAGDAIAALKASLKPTAICMRDGVWNSRFDARYLVPGDLIELASGAAVPADCMINHGQIEADESAMTGESLPVVLHERDMAKMGGTVAAGETHATVVFTGINTFFGKTASLLGVSDRYSNLQKLLMTIIIILCVLSFTLTGAAFIYLMVTHETLKKSASFAVVVIVASIPMAIEIVTTSTLAIGSRSMSHFGAIVSRLAAIEDLAGLNMLCSDKTGTLTKNKMAIQEDAPTYEPNLTQMELLKQAAMATRWEAPPKDALDTLFLRCRLWYPGIEAAITEHVAANPGISQAQRDEWVSQQINGKLQEAMTGYESVDFMPFNPRVKRTESTIRVKATGVIMKVTKGAPHVIQALDKNAEKAKAVAAKTALLGQDGIRAVAIAVSDPIQNWTLETSKDIEVTWHLTGLLTFLDPPRDDTKDTIARSQAYGVPVRMITGDHILIAKKTCRDLQMGVVDAPGWPNIEGPDDLPLLTKDGKPPADLVKNYGAHIKSADGFAQVFPEHKFLIVETFRQLGYKCGMTGDGVNDAPALKRADVGIAVAGATDAARAAADIVLTQEGLSTIVLGIEISRSIFARMKSFLTYRIAATLQLLTFFSIAVFAFKPSTYVNSHTPSPTEYPTFFSLPVIFLMIITIINDGTLISIGYDYAVPSRYPERWVLPVLFMVSVALGAVACLSSLLMLYFFLSSSSHSLLHAWGIGPLQYGHIINAMFLKVAITDIFTLFSARTAHQFFFQRRPHLVLLCCAAIATGISTTLALAWPCGKLDTLRVCGLAYHGAHLLALWVWIYCFIVFLIQDCVKVGVWRVIIRYNLFNVNNEVRTSAALTQAMREPTADGKPTSNGSKPKTLEH